MPPTLSQGVDIFKRDVDGCRVPPSVQLKLAKDFFALFNGDSSATSSAPEQQEPAHKTINGDDTERRDEEADEIFAALQAMKSEARTHTRGEDTMRPRVDRILAKYAAAGLDMPRRVDVMTLVVAQDKAKGITTARGTVGRAYSDEVKKYKTPKPPKRS